MLGRNSYTQAEFDQAKAAVEQQLAAYASLAAAIGAGSDEQAKAALEAFEPLFANTLALALDRYFVHRVRAVSGKDGNPLNEVELLTESLMSNNGVFQGNNVIKYVPEKSVVGLTPGDRIRLTAEQFEQLCRAFLDELERRFVKEG
jgi:hypothetical protein